MHPLLVRALLACMVLMDTIERTRIATESQTRILNLGRIASYYSFGKGQMCFFHDPLFAGHTARKFLGYRYRRSCARFFTSPFFANVVPHNQLSSALMLKLNLKHSPPTTIPKRHHTDCRINSGATQTASKNASICGTAGHERSDGPRAGSTTITDGQWYQLQDGHRHVSIIAFS